MANHTDYLDELLGEVAEGRLLPQEALTKFFLHKKEAGDATLTDDDQAFITAMDTVEVAHSVAKWCARNAADVGGVQSVTVDVRGRDFFHPRRRPPQVDAVSAGGAKVRLFSPVFGANGSGEYREDCLHAEASFAEAQVNPAFLPVFCSVLDRALAAHGLPKPEYLK